MKIVEIRRADGRDFSEVNSLTIRGTIKVNSSLETAGIVDVIISVENHEAHVVALGEESGRGISDDLTISIDFFEGDIDTSESKGAKSEDADKKQKILGVHL